MERCSSRFRAILEETALKARAKTKLQDPDAGHAVALLFEGGDSRLPLLIGVVQHLPTNEALNQEEFFLSCIPKEAGRGTLVGTVSTLPFVALPATVGVATFTGVGAISGGLSYTIDVVTGSCD